MLPYLKKIQQWCPDSVLERRHPTGISVQSVHDFLGSHFSSKKHFLPGKIEALADLGTPALHLEDGAGFSDALKMPEIVGREQDLPYKILVFPWQVFWVCLMTLWQSASTVYVFINNLFLYTGSEES